MKKKVLAAVIAVIVLGVVFKLLGESDTVSIPEAVTKVQQALSDSGEDSSEVSEAASQSAGSPYKYYYYKLNNDEKKAYDNVLAKVYSFPSTVKVPALNQDELNEMFQALLYDNPDLFFLGSHCTLSSIGGTGLLSLDYRVSKSDYKSALKKIENTRDEILSNVADRSDEWKTEKQVHDALAAKLGYDYTDDESNLSTIYGALADGTASCEGYSKAMKYILDYLGIESYVLAGKATDTDGDTDSHMWNVVKINGCYCHLDLTWDDPVNGNYKTYEYFNLSDRQINCDHSNWSFDYDCTSVTQSYSYKAGFYFTSYSVANNEELARAIAKELDSGNTAIELRFSDMTAYSAGYRTLIEEYAIYDVITSADKYCSLSFSHSDLSFSQNRTTLVMTFIPNFK